MGMNIGFHGYEPAFQSGQMMTSAGGSRHLTTTISEFTRLGHQVFWFGEGSNNTTKSANVSDVKLMDVIFLYWRWAMPEYLDRQKAYTRQMEIIKMTTASKTPVIVHDQDHKIDKKTKEFLIMMNVTLTEPSLFPRTGYSSLMYPSDRPLTSKYNPHSRFGLCYVGNNYERYDQTKRYLADARIAAIFYGNWLIKSDFRESPDQVKSDFPNVTFQGRLEADQVINCLRHATATIHLAKSSYNETGFITARWAEAASAACPAFVPKEFKFIDGYSNVGIVENASDVIRFLDVLDSLKDPNLGKSIVEWQRDFVNQYSKPDAWIEIAQKVQANQTVIGEDDDE